MCVKGNRLKYRVGISDKLGDCDWDERILTPLRIWEECTDSDWTLDFTMLGTEAKTGLGGKFTVIQASENKENLK